MLSCVRTPAVLSPPRLFSTVPTCSRARVCALAMLLCQRMPAAAVGADQAAWSSLGTPHSQLLLSNTLPTGQSFRWRLTAPPDTYTGVVGQRVVQLRQRPDDVHWRVLARGPGASQMQMQLHCGSTST
ncbi:hypothetical protein COO60DRAFT_1169431 [Scenedesmus sp. NREL 46B-D3]|nr:hypothetical protein COO60DRAFT_1169431 [Scenedesmus sp. NREL 46B-D3]